MTSFIFLSTLAVLTCFSLAAPALNNVSDFPGTTLLLLLPSRTTLSPVSSLSTVQSTRTAVQVSTLVTTVTTTTTVLAAVTDIITVSPTSITTWAAPAQMTDLSVFNISTFAGGQQNLEIVNGIPANASATVMAVTAESTGSWDNSTSVLRLLYPADSINPGNEPQGGAQFYATPLQMDGAKNVSLEYSIFFPVNFDWVLAGKLPGLYGGHKSCSGGDDALTCFSTRLMWRTGGAGELYLYAPKNKQTAALCNDPQSVCDTTYGLSIGRGSFKFSSGSWTHVRQTVSLNTPGEQNGEFTLQVDGKQVIHRSDVFYRDVPPSLDAGDEDQAVTPAAKIPFAQPAPASASADLLGSLLGGILRRQNHRRLDSDAVNVASMTANATPTNAATVLSTSVITSVEPSVSSTCPSQQVETPGAEPVGFTGLFFSTFFGGHEQQYATPVDQYVWFKDFAMARNS